MLFSTPGSHKIVEIKFHNSLTGISLQFHFMEGKQQQLEAMWESFKRASSFGQVASSRTSSNLHLICWLWLGQLRGEALGGYRYLVLKEQSLPETISRQSGSQADLFPAYLLHSYKVEPRNHLFFLSVSRPCFLSLGMCVLHDALVQLWELHQQTVSFH